MAIIRIKRTTTSNLPTGLTFGEMAFVQGSGYTANRLYIADNAGVCIWVGAQILNQPTYWSGATAETTVPTVAAVRDFVIGFGGGTFPADIKLNLSGTKSFGKYVNGQTLPAAGKTPIQVIQDALVESIAPTAVLQGLAGYGDPTVVFAAIPFGATAIRIGITWGYTVNTPGATIAGSTLEYSRGAGAYSTISTSLYDTTAPFWTQSDGQTLNPYSSGGNNYHAFTQTQYDTSAINYRYTIRDDTGLTHAATFTITPTAYDFPDNSVTVGFLGSAQSGESSTVRERGNTGTTMSGTLSSTNNSNWIKITDYLVQYQINSGTWYNALNNIANDTTYTSVTPAASVSLTNLQIKPAVSPINTLGFRIYVKDTYSTSGILTSGSPPTVNFRKKVFYGATASVPTTAAQVRTLPQSFLLSTNSGSTSGSGSLTVPGTPTSYLTYVIALPDDLTLNDFAGGGNGVVSQLGEILFGNSNTALDRYTLSSTLTTANDFSGTAVDYNIYTYTAASAADPTYHTFNFSGTIDNTN